MFEWHYLELDTYKAYTILCSTVLRHRMYSILYDVVKCCYVVFLSFSDFVRIRWEYCLLVSHWWLYLLCFYWDKPWPITCLRKGRESLSWCYRYRNYYICLVHSEGLRCIQSPLARKPQNNGNIYTYKHTLFKKYAITVRQLVIIPLS